MSLKRDLEEDGQDQSPEPDTKRVKKENSKQSRQHQNSSIDPTWGQKYVFSSSENATTIPAGEESEFEDDSEAMAYLMSVRYATLLSSFNPTLSIFLALNHQPPQMGRGAD